jgi:hypothetical protein
VAVAALIVTVAAVLALALLAGCGAKAVRITRDPASAGRRARAGG